MKTTNAKLYSDGRWYWLEVNGERISNIIISNGAVKIDSPIRIEMGTAANPMYIPPPAMAKFTAEMVCVE